MDIELTKNNKIENQNIGKGSLFILDCSIDITHSPFPRHPNPLTYICSGFVHGWDIDDCLSLEKRFSSMLTVNSPEIQKRNYEIKSAIDSESVDFRNASKEVLLES